MCVHVFLHVCVCVCVCALNTLISTQPVRSGAGSDGGEKPVTAKKMK